MGPGWHVYSLDQPKGGPMKSQVNPVSSSDFKITGTFLPNKNAHIVPATLFPVASHEHSEQVTWSAPIELAAGVDAKTLEIHGDLDGQVCSDINGSCIPFVALPTKFVARLASAKKSDQPIDAAPAKVAAGSKKTEPKKPAAKLPDLGFYTLPSKLATITGHLASEAIAPGESTSLLLTITPADHWHTYRYEDTVPDGVISKPTLIVFSERSGLEVGRPTTPAKVITPAPLWEGATPTFYYDGPVTFTLKVTAPADAQPGSYRLAGNIGMMVCTDETCDKPMAFMFQVDVPVAAKAKSGKIDVAFGDRPYGELLAYSAVEKQAAGAVMVTPEPTSNEPAVTAEVDHEKFEIQGSAGDVSMGKAFFFAFIGGFILNFMPCVLPVIGLKVMSFVDQAGESRGKAFMLNVWYSLGLIAVFMVLATLASVASLGWGQQFNYAPFSITMAAIIFVMALSFLGVWEIPIPGFVGSGRSAELASKEGAAGAFSKGVITTILATPCSGPGLAAALTFSATQPPAIVYALFLSMGLGMSMPYLIIGANPRLISFIPKPGPWMETFKEILGFVLLGTVVYMLTIIPWQYIVPSIALFFALWGACWWIGRIPVTASGGQKFKGWAMASVVAAALGYFCFFDAADMGEYRFYGLYGTMNARFTSAIDQEVNEVMVEGRTAKVTSDNELPWQPFSKETLEQLVAENKTVMVDFTADW